MKQTRIIIKFNIIFWEVLYDLDNDKTISMCFQIVRKSGARGAVFVPYRTLEGTAVAHGEDYDDNEGELLFEDEETE